MDCEQTKRLLAPYVLGDFDNDPQRCSQLQAHLLQCPECAEMYGGFQETIGFVLNHKAEFAQAFKKARVMEEKNTVPVESSTKLPMNRSLFAKISAFAACLIAGIGLFYDVNQSNKAQDGSSTIASNRQQNPVQIEFVSGGPTEMIPAGQLIAASDELKTLRINNNRQMVLNIGTELSIEPYNLGCVVTLNKGEIYAEVEHDGKPFIIETSHGRAVITGTTFNIKADNSKTDLVVIDGSVQFDSEKSVVAVQGGYRFSIVSGTSPTKPVACNVMQIAKWATKHRVKPVHVDIPTNAGILELAALPLIHMPYCDLEDVNFEVWIDQHRAWFEREFPWTKRLQKLLNQNDIEVDTVDLLIESGDLWRFAWPEYSQQRILAEDPHIIQKIANQYGVEVNHLTSVASLPSAKEISNIEEFEKWLDAFEQGKNDLTIDSIHAATFLIYTRSLGWYAINHDRVQVQDKKKVLNLLAEQVKVVSDSIEIFNSLLMADKNKSVCLLAQCDELIKDFKSNISSTIEIEKELVGYEVVSE